MEIPIDLIVISGLGCVLGVVCGHVALVIPRDAWRSLPAMGTELWAARRQEHYIGGFLGGLGLPVAYLLRSSFTDLVVTSVFLLVLIPALIIDLRHHLVYPVMTLVGFLCALGLNPVAGEVDLDDSLFGAALGVAIYLPLFVLVRVIFEVEAPGFGDVLLAGIIGGMVGYELAPAAFLLGSLFGALASGWLLLIGRKGRRDYIPFGSGMCLAAIVVLIAR